LETWNDLVEVTCLGAIWNDHAVTCLEAISLVEIFLGEIWNDHAVTFLEAISLVAISLGAIWNDHAVTFLEAISLVAILNGLGTLCAATCHEVTWNDHEAIYVETCLENANDRAVTCPGIWSVLIVANDTENDLWNVNVSESESENVNVNDDHANENDDVCCICNPLRNALPHHKRNRHSNLAHDEECEPIRLEFGRQRSPSHHICE
jgi:hypothetical protein